jgi:hypothetical protein
MKLRRHTDPLLVRVLAALNSRADEIPPGYKTIDQWATDWKVARTTASKVVHKAVEMGEMDSKKFMATCRKDARPYPVAHFRKVVKPRQRPV